EQHACGDPFTKEFEESARVIEERRVARMTLTVLRDLLDDELGGVTVPACPLDTLPGQPDRLICSDVETAVRTDVARVVLAAPGRKHTLAGLQCQPVTNVGRHRLRADSPSHAPIMPTRATSTPRHPASRAAGAGPKPRSGSRYC